MKLDTYLEFIYTLRKFAEHVYGEPSGDYVYDILVQASPDQLYQGGFIWHKEIVEHSGSNTGTAIRYWYDKPADLLNTGIQEILLYPALYNEDQDKDSGVFQKDALFFAVKHYASSSFVPLRGAFTELFKGLTTRRFDWASERSLRHPQNAYDFAKRLPDEIRTPIYGLLMTYKLRMALKDK